MASSVLDSSVNAIVEVDFMAPSVSVSSTSRGLRTWMASKGSYWSILNRQVPLTNFVITSAVPTGRVNISSQANASALFCCLYKSTVPHSLSMEIAGLSAGMSEMWWNANWHDRDRARESLVLRRVTVATEPWTVCQASSISRIVGTGRDAVAAGLAHFFTAFPDAHWHALDDLETTDRAMGRYVLTATLQRDMGNLKAAGQRLELRGVHILETAQGLIQRSEDFWDSKTFHNQMNTMNTGAKA
uniref:Uncharacterized protein n=1 Tax=Arthrobacter sp. IF1 TaxID=376661 RepID=D1MYS2_9MICC|nr:hypothetical protein [Arthrobacter sp. IF1]